MARYYAHRITKRERAAIETLYAPSPQKAPRRALFGYNSRDAFSHSVQCDAFFSTVSQLPGGVPHLRCLCWCHNAQHLFTSAEPEYDLTPPPEYANSADRGFLDGLVLQNATAMEGDTTVRADHDLLPDQDRDSADSLFAADWEVEPPIEEWSPETTSVAAVGHGDHSTTTSRTGFSNWSQKELQTGRCSNCGDSLKNCECVE